jgi:HD-GYP domain-containing protein (c-di-GMP phosphodiesterase class II)
MMREMSGRHFDAQLFAAFERIQQHILPISEALKDAS